MIDPCSDEAASVSIVIPVFNRSALLDRCLASVQRQDREVFEVLVCDDGSSEDLSPIYAQYPHLSLRLIRSEINQGVGAARNMGIRAATGRWCLMLDSDDELLPGALSAIQGHLTSGPKADIHCFRSIWDDGFVSPERVTSDQLLDFPGYLQFLEIHVESSVEMMYCASTEILTQNPYPERRADVPSFYLGLHKTGHSKIHSEVTRAYHQHPHQITRALSDGRRTPEENQDTLDEAANLLENFEQELTTFAPRTLSLHLRRGAAAAGRMGDKRTALRLIHRAWQIGHDKKLLALTLLVLLNGSNSRVVNKVRRLRGMRR